MNKRILVVAREAERRAALARTLIAAGYSVELAEEPKRAREVARSGNVALALMAPVGFGAAGPDLARELHEMVGKLIVAEGPDENAQDIVGRVNAALEPARTDPTARASEVLLFDGWTLDLPARSLRRGDGQEVPLTRSEFELLTAFVRNPGWVLSRDQLRDAVAGRGAEPYERSIDMLVGRLRRKLELDPKAPRLILTVPGSGYKFAARPRTVARSEDRPAAPDVSDRAAVADPPYIGFHAAQAPVQSRPAERRQVTVTSCEFVLSGPTWTPLDPEDLQIVVAAYGQCCRETIHRFGGTVLHHVGHRFLACFGYPQAHEEAVAQAVRAGLMLAQAIPDLQTVAAARLQARIGIATGVVIVGDLVAKDTGQEQGVLGEAPKLAEALQSIAEPGQVVIAGSTRRLAGSLFQYRDIGASALRSFAAPVQAAQVLGTSAVESRYEARQESRPTPLVGREEELERLLRHWHLAARGSGKVVLLTGEPGIGKSRLAVALEERLGDEPHLRMRYACSPHHSDSALYPVIRQLERSAGFERTDGPREKLAKLEGLLSRSGTGGEEMVALFAELLSLPTEGRSRLPEMSPQKRKATILAALLSSVQLMSTRQPLLMIFEDAHWVDPTSLELLSLAVERVAALPVLLLVTARPEFLPPWPSHAHVTTLTLTRLSRDDVVAMVAGVAGGTALPDQIVRQIFARADGIPLFVEELTKSVLESGVIEERAQGQAVNAAALSSTIPATLHDSLMARLDRLGEVRDVAQIGAALGRQFSHELIGTVATMPQRQLDNALDQLVGAGLVYRGGTPPYAEYTFKHALVQDAAYSTLLRTQRQQLHARIAATLEEQFPEIVTSQPALLAHHWADSGLVEKAVGYWLMAGQQALARSAMAEAQAQFRKGLVALSSLPESGWRQQHELSLEIGLGRALTATEGYTAPSVGETYARARRLCEQLKLPPQLMQALYGQWNHRIVRGELEQARQMIAEVAKLRDPQSDVLLRWLGCYLGAVTNFFIADFAAARVYAERGLHLYDPTHRPAFGASDTHVGMLLYLSCTLFCLGYLDQARARRDEALAEARQLGQAYTLCYALAIGSVGDWVLNARNAMLQRADELVALAAEQRFSQLQAAGTMFRGWSMVALGQPENSLAMLHHGLDAWRAQGGLLWVPFLLALEADACAKLRQPEDGLKLLTEAARVSQATQERFSEAEIHRLRGELLMSTNKRAAAEDSFCQAIAIAQGQGARIWELRATNGLARLWRSQSKRTEARDLLAPIYGWFTEGFDTPDLNEAKALLDALA